MSSRKTRLMLLFTSLYLVAIIGMLYTENTKTGLGLLRMQSAIFFFPLIFGTTSVLDNKLFERLFTHLLIATALASITGLVYGLYNYVYTGEIELLTGHHILLFHVLRPVLMGIFCLLSSIIAFERLTAASSKMKMTLWIFISLMALMIFLMGIRLIIFCWLMIVLYYFIKIFQKWSQRLLFIFASIILIFITGFTINPVKKQWNELFDFSSSSNIVLDQDSSLGKQWRGKAIRIAIWKCSEGLLKRNWIAGVGTGDVQDSLQQAYEERKFYFASRYNRYNAHNEYLQMTLANGLPGLFVLLSCIFVPFFGYRKNYPGNMYLLFLLVFAMVGTTESLLQVNKGIIWYSFFNSIFAFGYFKTKTNYV